MANDPDEPLGVPTLKHLAERFLAGHTEGGESFTAVIRLSAQEFIALVTFASPVPKPKFLGEE